MTDKTAAQIANMKKQTIGVEVEMNGISRVRYPRLASKYSEYSQTLYLSVENPEHR